MPHAEPTITATFLGKTFVFPISSLSIEVQKGLYEEMWMTDKQREERDKKRKESEVDDDDDDDESDDGFEDCECGYTHHYEDKCPKGTQCKKYEKWNKDEESDEEEYHGYVFEKGTTSHNTECSCDKMMMNDGKGGYYCDCGDAPLKE
jgi:hypothetical protein